MTTNVTSRLQTTGYRWKAGRWAALLFVAWFAVGGGDCPATAQAPDVRPTDVVRLFEAGQDAHQAGQLDEALRLYDAALALDDTLAPIHFQRGMALLALKRTTEAVAAFEHCLTHQPDFLRGWLHLGAAALAVGANQRAEQAYARALELSPENREARLQLAQLALARQEADRTLALLDPLGLDAKTPDVDVLRGQAYRLGGQIEPAIEAFSRVLSRLPDHPVARRGRGDAYAAQGRAEAALDDWQRAYTVNATPELAADIISALHQLGRQDAVRAFIRSARTQFPNDERLATIEAELTSDAALDAAAALLRAGRFAEAAVAYAPLVAQSPEATPPRAGLATALFKLERFAEAAQHFETLRRLQPEVAATYFFLGVCYDKIRDYRMALAAYEAFLARADGTQNRLEIEKVQLRLPSLKRQAEQSKPRKP
ncbi:MAG: tetratricopeptide repeat protein [Chloracidobacterium sp.]|uniref:Tetratricopeptide repeat protein n=1 Tax=Chloracidobacterium validum TaxID=2821543 RepID=A0ABX8B5Y0_9BACT|nr:tetratricopeptide repeat protein [Chloracidobacterium validum]QUW02381.1 tetratricopeptide repeat protein [Chloracidobacterium validum]